MAEKSPEQRKSYKVVKSFKGMNTRQNRTALDDEEFAWLENVQPVGFGNLKAVSTYADQSVSWSHTVVHLASCNINNTDYVFAFQSDGSCEYYNIKTATKGTLAGASTFSATGARLRQWKDERAIIGDPNKGFFTWDGTHLVKVGSLSVVGITNTGSGYTEPPDVTVSAPDDPNGTQATIIASITNNASTIQTIQIGSGGTGYTTFPTITIAPPTTPYGVQATAYVSAISGAGVIQAVTISNPGYGYTSAPAITVGGPGTGASLTAVLGVGIVTALTVTNAGSGYLTAPTISFSGGGGSGAAAVAGPLTFETGTIGVFVTSGGAGYSSAPTVTFTGGSPTRAAVATAIVFGGIVTEIVVTDPGAGYTSAPTVGFSGGSPTTAATATASLTSNPISDIASFQGRVWISQGRRVYYSAANQYSDFVSVSAGNIEMIDDTLHSNITALVSANNFLYVFGEDSINVFSNLVVGTTGITTFTNTNTSASIGTSYQDAIFSYFRSILFINQYGVFALVGATVTKISDALDGVFPYIDFTTAPSGGQVLINSILCAGFNVSYADPILKVTRPIQLVFFDKKWFTTSQGTLAQVVPVTTAKQLYLYGTGGQNLLRLYSDATSKINTTIRSALWPMEDTIRNKQALKFAFEASVNGVVDYTVTVDSEAGSSPSYLFNNYASWVNNSSLIVPWKNNGNVVIPWVFGAFATGYELFKSDAQQIGKYLGLTITSVNPAYTLNTLEMEYELRTRF